MLRCIPTCDHPTVAFACAELTRHWDLLRPVWQGADPILRVGPGLEGLPPVTDPERDDAIAISLGGEGGGVVTGTNPRSVLIAAYRLLHELGFWFVRPGPEGTLLRYNGKTAVQVSEAASYRHRGFCIEGAVSFENVLELIDWLPKGGFNTYFTQFLTPYEFFKTWYAHDNNPLLAGTEPVPTVEEVDRFTYGPLQEELRKRDLIFQAAGHGWTTAAIGIDGLGWDEAEEPGERYRGWLAQIDGRRALFNARPLNTNLCYSNPEVREALTEEVMAFLRRHPQVDTIHFWLADDSNNTCECEACQKAVPSAFYVDMLNLLDEKLTRAGLKTRVVFLAYLDLLWPPEGRTLKNPDRFVFMFAPITRSYSAPLPTDAPAKSLPPFVRNHLTMPADVGENIAFLRAWQACAPCDSFIYEYHYMWDQFKDVSDYANARVLWQDVRNLRQLGLNGYISCQQTRVFWPCGFGMHVLGQTLWNRETDFEAMAGAYFEALFASRAGRVRAMMQAARRFHPECLRGERPIRDAAVAADYAAQRADSLRDSAWCAQQAHGAQGVEAALWQALVYWCEFCVAYAHCLEAWARGLEDEREIRLAGLRQVVRIGEPAHQEMLDVYWFLKTLDRTVLPVL